MGVRRPQDLLGRFTLKVQRDGRNFTVDVAADGEGLSRTRAPRCSARSLTGSGSPASSRPRWWAFGSAADGMTRAGWFGISR